MKTKNKLIGGRVSMKRSKTKNALYVSCVMGPNVFNAPIWDTGFALHIIPLD